MLLKFTENHGIIVKTTPHKEPDRVDYYFSFLTALKRNMRLILLYILVLKQNIFPNL